jgi:membrane protease YdiL (CAAX protease family)
MAAEKITLNILLLATAAVMAVEVIARLAIGGHWTSPMTAVGGARLVGIGILIRIVQDKAQHLGVIGLSLDRVRRGISRGLVWSAFSGAVAFGGMGVLFLCGLNPLHYLYGPLPEAAGERTVFLLVGVLIAPAAEEIYFRGILYGYLRRWGIFPALLVSTFCFVLPHLTGNTLPVTQMVGGLVFAVSYEIEKNLLVPFLIHSSGNLALFALPLIGF